jgi:hypothetical protein
MSAPTRKMRSALVCLAAVVATGAVKAGPVDDLLPPPVRQTEKRTLGGPDDQRRMYYPGRGGIGAAFSRDGKLLLTASGYQGMVLWDVRSGRQLAQFLERSGNEGVSAAFTPDSKQLITASWGGHREGQPVSLWDVARRTRLRSLDEDVNDTPFTAAAVAPDSKTVALAGAWGRRSQTLNVVIWDLASGDEIRRIEGLAGAPMPQNRTGQAFQALAYSPNGRTLAVLLKGRVVLVEVATGKRRGELTFATTADSQAERGAFTLGSLAFTADGRRLLAGCSDGAIRRFDLRSGRELPPLSGHGSAVIALCCTPDGKRIHSYGLDGRFLAWRTSSGREWQPKSGPLADAALEALWDTLSGDDPRDLFGSVRVLAAAPAQSVPFLRKRLAAVPQVDVEQINRLVAEVQKGDYNARKKAVRELRKIGAAAAPALHRSQERGYDELLRRLMFEFDSLALPAEQVRAVRAVAVLERVGTDEAGKLLKKLAEGAAEAPLTLEAKAALARLGKPAEPADEPTPETLWKVLAVEDSVVAYRAVRALAVQPSTATLLRERLKEIVAKDTFNDDPKRVAKLIANLDSKVFAVRDRASKALANLGQLAVPSLRKAVKATTDLEAKRRLEELLGAAEKASPPPEVLRIGRALEALELMGGPEARQALEGLAKEVQIKWIREAVSDSLRHQQAGKR